MSSGKNKIELSNRCAIFIMPRSSGAWRGSEALWITAAGWALAAERKFGEAWVLTTDRCATPTEVLKYPIGATAGDRRKGASGFLPLVLITLLKDIRLYFSTRNHAAYTHTHLWQGKKVVFVWEHHDLFAGPGKKIADKLGVPFIKYVHAPQVWESAKWNVRRPYWGKLLERFAETRSLKQADLLACVSEEVKEKLYQLGVQHKKVIVSPMAVDQSIFEGAHNVLLRDQLRLNAKLIIGWAGSFRGFHGLDLLIDAFKQITQLYDDVNLVLVGDGLERQNLEEQIAKLDITDRVVFTGRVPFSEIPDYIKMFDVAVVSASSTIGFHYSPLKLREYLIAGVATVAPRAGEIPVLFEDDKQLSLYDVNNPNALVRALSELISNPEKRQRLSREGKDYALKHATWDYELEKLLSQLTLAELAK